MIIRAIVLSKASRKVYSPMLSLWQCVKPWHIPMENHTFRFSLQCNQPKVSTLLFSCPILALGFNQLTAFGCELSAKLDAALSFWLI